MNERDLVNLLPGDAAEVFMNDVIGQVGKPEYELSRKVSDSHHYVEYVVFSKGLKWVFEWDNVENRCEVAMFVFQPLGDGTSMPDKIGASTGAGLVGVTRVPYGF